jgi:pimeloyl-ACP methyl ester carboxylesterase
MTSSTRSIARTPVLEIGYESVNDAAPDAVVLLHGFPYDARAFDAVVPILAAQGLRVVVPFLRGFGPTAFRFGDTPRSGQQAALGRDLIDLMDSLGIDRAVVGGYDWGGRAACIAAALFPERVVGLVSVDGYNIQNLARASDPAPPGWESTYWYQYYFQTERGRRGLEVNRDELCQLLWRTWSPTWSDAAAVFERSSASLHNPDFVDVVIHSYRHRMGAAPGDPQYQLLEDLLAASPSISVPTIVLESTADGIGGPSASEDATMFVGPYEHRFIADVGHNLPQEAPEAFAAAVLDVRDLTG